MALSDHEISSSVRALSFFEIIPGEIRNEIFSICISHAFAQQKIQQPWQRPPPPKPTGLAVSVHSRKNGNGHVRLHGIGPLPLLAVNRQAYYEVSSLVYALVEHVSIGNSITQYLDEDPNERWNFAYSLVEKRPDIHKLAKTVKVVLPRTANDVLRTTYDSLRNIHTSNQIPKKSNAMAILPGLKRFLGSFESLNSLTIVIVVDKSDIPNFQDLIPLWKVYSDRMTIHFEGQAAEYDYRRLNWIENWSASWEKCVSEDRERTMIESGGSNG